MTNTVLVTPKFLKPGSWGQPSPSQKKKIKEFTAKNSSNSFGVNENIEQLLQKLNTAKNYDDIPETIRFAYTDLLDRNIDLKDVYDVINLTARLAANRLNEKPKEILFTGFATDRSLGVEDYKKITSAGFTGCTLSPMIYGIEAARESMHSFNKDPSHWSGLDPINYKKIIALKVTPMEISLTFRQEQIFNMVCKGMTNYQIAKRLSISESTVKMHIGIVLKKYNVKHRSQLILSQLNEKS
jgi:DNA-binding CsgD family transcriptional regulator